MTSYRLKRRNFLWGIGAATGLQALLRLSEAAADGVKPPKRFMVIHHPVGGNHDNWKVTGTEYDFDLSMILDPFKDVRSNMVVISGMKIVNKPRAGTPGAGCHEGNTVCLMTGEPHDGLWPGNGGDDAKVGAASVDQLFLTKAPTTLGAAMGKIPSLQVACDERTDEREYSTRRLSASGPGVPMDPYLSPAKLYDRVFGNFMPNTSTQTDAELAKARAAKKSVLDFALKDLARLKTLVGASEKPRLEAHEALIRDMETRLDSATNGGDLVNGCVPGAKPTDPAGLSRFLDNGMFNGTRQGMGDQDEHKLVAQLHFAILHAALACDMTRVITFQYSPGTNHVSFQGFYPGNASVVKLHHTQSHDGGDPNTIPFLANVTKWYSEITAAFLLGLKQTKEVDGTSLLDNMIIPYITEARWDHNNNENAFPVTMFGGAPAGLQTSDPNTPPAAGMGKGRMKSYGSKSTRPMNDMWLACAKMLDVPVTTLGTDDMHTTPLDINVA
jgi:hypothetical protein